MAEQPGQQPPDHGRGWVDPDEATRIVPKHPRPAPHGHNPGRVDPDAPTGVAPRHPRPTPQRQQAAGVDPDAPTGQAQQQPRPTPPIHSSPNRTGYPQPQQLPPPEQRHRRTPPPAQRPQSPHPSHDWDRAPRQPHAYSPGGPQPPTAAFPPQDIATQGPDWRRHRGLLIVAGSVAGALILVIALIVTVNGGGADNGGSDNAGGAPQASGGGAASPAEAVKSYLEALAAGDAEKALSYQKGEPASKELLTDEVLQKQIAKMPITDIRILDGASEQDDLGLARVHVAARFGDNLSDAMIMTSKIDGRLEARWRG